MWITVGKLTENVTAGDCACELHVRSGAGARCTDVRARRRRRAVGPGGVCKQLSEMQVPTASLAGRADSGGRSDVENHQHTGTYGHVINLIGTLPVVNYAEVDSPKDSAYDEDVNSRTEAFSKCPPALQLCGRGVALVRPAGKEKASDGNNMYTTRNPRSLWYR
ncbi:hypothetical protein SCHPADRAFT_887376 [Schizopora paradoxa]|uniref:Uncharacterized protein n=1 Tax=Schizopora paradoxa TaxID=27342 RepID=A0A0H2RXX7_9AGAM|nr:hypothetical protein SCHPADRAFT_887376 [Schizopora paradoxa]